MPRCRGELIVNSTGEGVQACAPVQAVEQYIAAQAADEEAAAEELPDPNARPGDSQHSVPVVGRSQAGSIVMPSPSLRANASLAANSYQEAIAASLRSRGMSFE